MCISYTDVITKACSWTILCLPITPSRWRQVPAKKEVEYRNTPYWPTMITDTSLMHYCTYYKYISNQKSVDYITWLQQTLSQSSKARIETRVATEAERERERSWLSWVKMLWKLNAENSPTICFMKWPPPQALILLLLLMVFWVLRNDLNDSRSGNNWVTWTSVRAWHCLPSSPLQHWNTLISWWALPAIPLILTKLLT